MKDILCNDLYAPSQVVCFTKICPAFGHQSCSFFQASPSPAPNLQSYCMVLYACAEAWRNVICMCRKALTKMSRRP